MKENENFMKEMVAVLKGDYKNPGKALIWGMAVGQWMAIIIVRGVFLSMFVFFISSSFQSNQRVNSQKVNTEQQGRIVKLEGIIKNLTKFLEISARSLNERQNILNEVTQTINLYLGRQLDQQGLEKKVKGLTSILSSCNTSRGTYIDLFAENINPFEMPEVSEDFKKLIGHNSIFKRHVIDPQEENERWKALCDFCQGEVKKANAELIKVLNAGTNSQEAW